MSETSWLWRIIIAAFYTRHGGSFWQILLLFVALEFAWWLFVTPSAAASNVPDHLSGRNGQTLTKPVS